MVNYEAFPQCSRHASMDLAIPNAVDITLARKPTGAIPAAREVCLSITLVAAIVRPRLSRPGDLDIRESEDLKVIIECRRKAGQGRGAEVSRLEGVMTLLTATAINLRCGRCAGSRDKISLSSLANSR